MTNHDTLTIIAEILTEDGIIVAPKRSRHGGLRIKLPGEPPNNGFWLALDKTKDHLYLCRLKPNGKIHSYGTYHLADPTVFQQIKQTIQQAPPAET